MTTRAERVEAWNREFADFAPYLDALGFTGDVRELGWIPDLLDEVVSDMRVLLGIDDPLSMTARDFFARARFLPSYQGAVGAVFGERHREEAEAEAEQRQHRAPSRGAAPQREPVVLSDDAFLARMAADPIGA